MSELVKAAQAKNAADQAYRSAITREIQTLKPMEESQFLAVLDCLIIQVAESRAAGKDMDSVMDYFRAGLIFRCGWGTTPPTDWPEDSEPKRWEMVARFIRRYRMLKASLGKVCWELKGLERGDDGFGDLMDSLPLAGRAVLDGLFQEDIANFKQLEKALEGNPLKDFILNGENYIVMALEKILEAAFTSVVSHITPRDEDDRRPANPHVVVNVTPVKAKERRSGDDIAINLTISGPFRDEEEAGKFAKQGGDGSLPIRMYRGVVQK